MHANRETFALMLTHWKGEYHVDQHFEYPFDLRQHCVHPGHPIRDSQFVVAAMVLQ